MNENTINSGQLVAPRPEAGSRRAGNLSQPQTTGQASRLCGVFKIVSFFTLVAVLAFGLNQFISAGLRRIKTSEFGAFNQAMSGQINAGVIINGSSRALEHYDPVIIQKISGESAYNLGRNGSQTDMQLAILKAYLTHNTKPKVVIQNLDLFTFEMTRPGEVYDPALYLPYIADNDIYSALRQISPETWKWRYIPLYGYAVEDMNFTWLTGLEAWFGHGPREDFILGYNPRDAKWTGEFDRFKAAHPTGTSRKIEPRGVQVLEDLLTVCQSQGIQTILVYSPEYSAMQALENNRAEIFGTFAAIAARHQVPVWDYSASPICQNQNLFFNSQHLNREGATVFTTDLAARLAKFLAEEAPAHSAGATPSNSPAKGSGNITSPGHP